jgi:hypothetical protein
VPIIVEIPKPRRWTVQDWRSLPNLRLPRHTEHVEDENGWLFRPDEGWKKPSLFRCDHGVYLTDNPDWQGWGIGDNGEPDFEEWIAWYCEICQAKFSYLETFREFQKSYKFIRPRRLEAGERRNREGKLFDRQPVYPENFTRTIKLRNRTFANDLRLQEDYETGQPRLETAAGYVAAAFGYTKAGRGHGPDSNADNIRLAWMASHEGTAIGSSRDALHKRAEWEATLPDVEHGIILVPEQIQDGMPDANWFPINLPRGTAPEIENLIGGLGLDESDFFDLADDWPRRPNKMPPDIMRRLMESDRKWLPRIPNARYLLPGRLIPDSTRRESFRTFYGFIPSSGRARCLDCDPERDFRHHPPTYPIGRADRSEYPNLDGWYSPLEWIQVGGKWRCRFNGAAILHYGAPTKHNWAQWKRKREYQPSSRENLVPLRRTKRWADDWRTERKMRDLAARLDMYRYGVGTVQPVEMMQAAWRNLRATGEPQSQSRINWEPQNTFWPESKLEPSVRDTPPRGERWRKAWLRTSASHGEIR